MSIFLSGFGITEVADKVALDAEVLILLSVLEGDGDCAAHVIVFEVDRQFGLLLTVPNLMELLVLLGVELDVDLNSAGESSEEGGEFILSGGALTIGYY